MDRDFFCLEQAAWGRGAVDLQSLLPSLAIEVCPGASDAKRLAPLLQGEPHTPVKEAAFGCSNGSRWQFVRLQGVGPIVRGGLNLD